MQYDKDDLQYVLENAQWKFAKTFATRAPHWYTLIEEWNDDVIFKDVAKQVRKYSTKEFFWGKPFSVWNYKGMKYWVMDENPEDAVLINKTFNSYQYRDKIGVEYNDTGEDTELIANKVLSIFNEIYDDHFVYEIGCGDTSNFSLPSFLDSQKYLGVDPIGKRIEWARAINKEHKFLIDRFETYTRGKFDKSNTILMGLYGTPNFIIPQYLKQVQDYAGYILMFYKEGKCNHPDIYPMYHTSERIDNILGVESKTIETDNYIIKYYG